MTRVVAFAFKLVHSSETKIIETAIDNKLSDLFLSAKNAFAEFINYDLYKLQFVLAGQADCEQAACITRTQLNTQIAYLFYGVYENVSFYIRPIEKNTGLFVERNNYLVIEPEPVRRMQASS
jgi:hypothetical protein